VVDQPVGTENPCAVTQTMKGPRVREDPETREDTTPPPSQTNPTTIVG
jgi:hypothetical protein